MESVNRTPTRLAANVCWRGVCQSAASGSSRSVMEAAEMETGMPMET